MLLAWLGLRRLEAELVEASPHLHLCPPSVHVTWWVGFHIMVIVIEKPRIASKSPHPKSSQTWTFQGRILSMQWVLVGRLSFPQGCSSSLLNRQTKKFFIHKASQSLSRQADDENSSHKSHNIDLIIFSNYQSIYRQPLCLVTRWPTTTSTIMLRAFLWSWYVHTPPP